MRRLALACAVVLSFTLVAGLTPAYAYQPPSGATFNAPRPFGNDADRYRIVRTIEKAIRKTRPTKKDPNPVIWISTYLLDRKASVKAMIGACKRGVAVRVILDEDIDNKNSRRLITALNSDNVKDRNGDNKADTKPKTGPCNTKKRKKKKNGRVVVQEPNKLFSRKQASRSVDAPVAASVTWGKDGSYVKRCDGSCRGPGGNMHSKFYVFTHSGRAKNVVMVSSSNLNQGGALLGWNDLYVMKRRPKSLRAYRDIHRAMTEDMRNSGKKVEVNDGPFTSRFFPMRKANKRNDPTMQDLRSIKCRTGKKRTQLNISMFYWKGKRGDYIADQLLKMARQGCNIKIIYGAPSVAIAKRLRAAAGAHKIDLWDSRWDMNDDGFNEVRTHAKYILVNGNIAGKTKSRQVWTGTQNWVSGSLTKGDENSLNIRLGSAYKKYLADWRRIRNHSRRLPYSQYGH